MKRELRQFEYTCDGYTRRGQRCHTRTVIAAYDDADADVRLMSMRHTFSGLLWHGYWRDEGQYRLLCNEYVHRDDPRDRTGRAPTDDERKQLEAWFDSTEMCDSCCRRVPKTEVEQGLHRHPAVMD